MMVARKPEWIDALPVAAALVERRDKRLSASGNAAFDAIPLPATWLASRVPIGAACRRVAATGEAERALGVDIGGDVERRSYLVDVAPIGDAALVSFTDTTAIATATRLLQRQMVDDPLTGLPNRAGFVEALERRMAAAERPGVVAINLSQFSRVNDCIGSVGGDELIVTVARRLKAGLRDGDLLARTGGDEFAVIVGGAPDEELGMIAARIRGVLEQPFRLSDLELKVDCALGCAGAGEGEDAEQIIRHAQLALKLAKRTRRVECYRPAALHEARRRFLVETALRQALVTHQGLHLAFQPLIDLANNRVRGFEVLARWRHEHLGMIAPNEFVAVAEDSGLIGALDRFVLDAALTVLAEWDARHGSPVPVDIAINLSAVELGDEDVAVRVGRALDMHGIDGRRLIVELTESAILAEPDKASAVLSHIKASGARIAMDDFGTGYSNLALLRRLPIDILKIDRSLVSDMANDADKAAIVRAILSLAQALGLKVTAEGIETAETARLLAMLGCPTGQGYHFARPLDPEAAYAYALAHG